MSTDLSAAPLASFEAKWSRAHPEFGLALRFVRGHEQSAFACLVFELEHAAFGIREQEPAAIKLHWWAEEFARARNGEARHPLTQALAARIRAAAIPAVQWQEAIVGALIQRDAEPAADAAGLFGNYARFYTPIGAIDAALFGTDAAAAAASRTRTRALRETAALPDVLREGKVPLPLDVLARHRLARGELSGASAARSDALREWSRALAGELFALVRREAIRSQPLGILNAVMTAADARRASQAATAREPLAALNVALGTLSIPVVWSAWRAARRSRA